MKPFFGYNETLEEESSDEELSFADEALVDIDVTAVELPYVGVEWIPPTFNDVKRLFSQAGLVYSDRRQSMLPGTLENLLFLQKNRALWNEATVDCAAAKNPKEVKDSRSSLARHVVTSCF
ncbi:hypothetical protein PPTG_02930 [Phytophthora nicotianae INRA-310]|uniref:Uncharacterized protein n=1 Tax=Phytophthora nicotianae (strain INRA-310) TaxID=761204 RepID=W2RD84_PHYN3|nr:hypothetical protein PPTG_02930 [Phytophthora nicotianae INRA-310]ETN23332.1 hypothetical protein PPTG_02930 [Phytophthora nicotianae INRA-310]